MQFQEHLPDVLEPLGHGRAVKVTGRAASDLADLKQMLAVADALLVCLGQPKGVLGVGVQAVLGDSKKSDTRPSAAKH